MDKLKNTQANNEKDENKQYYIPMEVTAETIKDFGIDPADVVWTKIGNRKKRVVMIAATEEQYKAYMRPLWREDKRRWHRWTRCTRKPSTKPPILRIWKPTS